MDVAVRQQTVVGQPEGSSTSPQNGRQSAWIGRWAGGRVKAGPRYVIERMVRGRRFSVALDVTDEAAAILELRLFERDPARYMAARTVQAAPEPEPDPLVDHWGHTAAWEAALVSRGCTADYAKSARKYVDAAGKALGGKRLSAIPLADVKKALGSTAKRARAIALRSFTHYLRGEGLLSPAADPTLALSIPAARPPRPRGSRGYPAAEVEAAYSRLPTQAVRDTVLVRLMTGLHGTEVSRLASGAGSVRVVDDPSGIYAVVSVFHKNKHEHVVSVSRRTHDALARLIRRGGCIESSTVHEALEKAGPIHAGRFRHTFATLALESGRLIHPTGQHGLTREVVANALGHSPATNRRHYDGVAVPPMVVVRLNLRHVDDPVVEREK
jgi:integrase